MSSNQRFNPPPNWPTPPGDWTPPPGWQPDPAWGPVPAGHQLWVEDKKGMGTGAKIALGLIGGLLGLCMLGVIIAAFAGGEDDAGADSAAVVEETTDPAAPSEESPAAEPSSEAPEPVAPEVAAVGTPVRDGKFEFTVTGVERVGTEIGPQYLRETAQGEFVVVRVNVTNIGDEARMLDSQSQVLFDNQGRKHSPSSAIFVLEDFNKAFLENINPGNSVQGAPILFDVPPGTALDRIELHDSMFSGGVDVSLAGS